jgi:N-acyl-D-aspartate/D-glutamate deacylase
MLRSKSRVFFVLLLFVCLTLLPSYSQKPLQSLLILNAQIADGTGAALYPGNVRIEGGRIVGIGKLAPEPGEFTLDAGGLVLAPGFIDIHNHSEESLPKDLAAETQVSPGSTRCRTTPQR